MPSDLERIQETIPFSFNGVSEDTGFSGLFLNWVLPSNGEPEWWSRSRDIWLRSYWKSIDALKTAVGTFTAKTLSIPFSIQPVNHGVMSNVLLAQKLQDSLYKNSGTISQGPMRGIRGSLSPFIIDYLTQDNGAFLLILGNAPGVHRPIIGAPLGVLHLDSARCIRTGDPKFPVLYSHESKGKGKNLHKIHYTRIIEMAHLPSPDSEMNGVGTCPVSCCIQAATEIRNIYQFSEEKFGSRPPRQILYAKKGATITELTGAIELWKNKLDNSDRTHFGGTLVVAPKNPALELELDVLSLTSAPDGFNRKEDVMLDKAEIAAAFGLDLLDLALSMGIQGQTRANADVQTRKGRGKGPGALIESIIEQLDAKYLPNSLQAIADVVDDDQDEQRAEIMDRRSQAYARQMQFSIRTARSTRIDMLSSKEITQQMFDELELSDGRLPSGIPVISLFYSEDELFQKWLSLDAEDPTNTFSNDTDQMLEKIESARALILKDLQRNNSKIILGMGTQALGALDSLKKLYTGEEEEPEVKDPPSLRKVERSELTGDKNDRELRSDNMPESSTLKEVDPAWIEENVDPYSLTEDQVKNAILSFNEANPDLDILEATVI